MSFIRDADEFRRVYYDGTAATVVELDPGGRIRISGYDGGDLIHCTSHSPDTAEEMADLLQRMATHSKGDR